MLKQSCVLVVAAFVLSLTIGCQTPPTGPSTDGIIGAPASGALVGSSDIQRLGYRVRWAAAPIGASRTLAQVAWLDNVIVFVDSPSNLVAGMSAENGNVIWQNARMSRADLFQRPSLYDGKVILNSETKLYVMNPGTGQIDKITPLAASVNSQPAFHRGYAIFGGLNGRVFGIDLKQGFDSWQYQMAEGIVASPVLVNQTVFVGDISGVYSLIDVDPVSDTFGRALTRKTTYDRITTPPAVSDEGIFLACEDQKIYCIDRNTGVPLWDYNIPAPAKSTPFVIRDRLVVNVPGYGLWCIDAGPAALDRPDRLLWQAKDVTDAHVLFAEDDRILVQDKGRLLTMDIETGRILMEIQTAQLEPIIVDEARSLLLYTASGRMLRLNRR